MTEPTAAILPTNTADRRATLYALYIVAIHCSDRWLTALAWWTQLPPRQERVHHLVLRHRQSLSLHVRPDVGPAGHPEPPNQPA